MNEKESNLYLLTGLIIGLGLGLLIAWVISPVKYIDTAPSALSSDDKDTYRQMIALAYQTNPDLGRARLRIAVVNPGDSYQVLAAQAQRMLAENKAPEGARALALLAADLSQGDPASAGTTAAQDATQAGLQETRETLSSPSAETPAVEASLAATLSPQEIAAVQTATPTFPPPTPTITLTPLPTFTPRPTSTPARVLEAPFILQSQSEMCEQTFQPGLIQIEVKDSNGEYLPGIQILVTGPDGQEKFFTGLYPEINLGYADYILSEGEVISIKVGEVSDTVNGLTTPACGGGWKLEFEQGKQ